MRRVGERGERAARHGLPHRKEGEGAEGTGAGANPSEGATQLAEDSRGAAALRTERTTKASAGAPRERRRPGHPLARHAALRVGILPGGLFLVLTVSFFLVNALPSDPARVILGNLASRPQIAQLKRALGLDHSLWERYGHYLDQLFAHASQGTSYYTHESINAAIVHRLASSAELGLCAIALALVYGVLLGTVNAYFRGRLSGRLSGALIGVGQATPDFVLGLAGTFVFFYLLHVLPAPTGQLSPGMAPPPTRTGAVLIDALLSGMWSTAASAAAHLVLPVAALAVAYSVVFARVARSTIGEALEAPHTEFARACGLPERTVVRYAYKAARGPLVTYLAIVTAGMIGGIAVVETLFSWNGLGQWAVSAILTEDIPAVQGFVLLSGAITLVTYVAGDILSHALDPRLGFHSR